MRNFISKMQLLLIWSFVFLFCKFGFAQSNLNGASTSTPIDPLVAPRPTLQAHFTTEKIKLDGRFTESAWQQADSTDGVFWMTIPQQGVHSSERSVVRILYNEKKLYLGATLYDHQPNKIIAAGLEQDFATQDSDIFGIALDTYHDRQNAFLFAINPAGAIFDAQAFNDQAYINRSWEGIVEVKTGVFAQGWTIEMAIPLTTLRFNKSDSAQTWGLNFSRRIRRRSEDSNWAPLPRQFRVYKMSQAGTLTGLRHLEPGRNIWIKPYASTVRNDGSALTGGRVQSDFDGGFDLKWGVTPQLTLDATMFTDFSQIEVDQQQVNLTRFSLFFPEKRDFFLENDGIFNFADQRVRNYRTGSSPRNFKLFHSRRIGLSAGRQPVPIAAGARLTGRLGHFDVGFLNMQTEADQGLPVENFTVLRLRRNILKSSDIGVMLTNRQATGQGRDAWNRAAGVDANLRVLGNMIVNSYFAVTDVPDASGNQQMAALQVAWRDPLWDTSFLLKTVGENFDPGIGFVSRRGIRQGFLTFGAHPQPRIKGIFEINPYVDVNVFTDSGWRLESREISPGLGVRFLNSSSLTLEISNRFERLADTTSIAGADVPAGEYDFTAVRLSYRSDSGKRLAGTLTLTHGDFFDGDRTSVSGSFAIRPSARVYFRGTFQHNRLRLGGQAFNADLVSARFNYGHNTRTFFSAFVQYIRAADELVTNLRFNLIHAPLSDIFLVYQDRRDLDTATAEPTLLDRALTLKVTKLFAF